MPKCDFNKVDCFRIQRDLETFLRNLTPLIRNEINLFIMLIIKLFITKKEDIFDLQTA